MANTPETNKNSNGSTKTSSNPNVVSSARRNDNNNGNRASESSTRRSGSSSDISTNEDSTLKTSIGSLNAAHRESTSSRDSDMENNDKVSRISDQVRDNASRIAEEATERARALASRFGQDASRYYDDASTWLRTNPSRTAMVVGAIAAVGLATVLLTRSRRSSSHLDRELG